MNLKSITIGLLIFFLTLLPRLHSLGNPVADWHSWRQSDTAAVARNLATDNFNLLFPQSHNFYPMSEGSLPNPNRYFLNEFPFYNAIVAGIYKITGVHEAYARLVSVIFASLGAVFLYLLIKALVGEKLALLTVFFYAFLPYNIFYGQVIMPDPTFVSLSIIGLYLVYLWTEKDHWGWAILAGLASALAMLVKPYAIFMALPAGYLLWRRYGWQLLKRFDAYLFAVIALLPLILWRWHINQYPEGMFGSDWLINQGNIRFKGAFFRWLVFERMNKLIFATGGFVLFWLGVVSPLKKKEGWFFIFWLASVAVYMTYFARGNVTHDYYQLPLVPIGCYLMAKGIETILGMGKGVWQKLLNLGVVSSLVLLTLAFGWYEVRGFFNINHPEIVQAGQAVDRLTPKTARVIAPYSKDPAFLYQTNRNGWSDWGPVEKWIEQEGATHLVSVNFDQQTKKWMDKCRVLEKTDKYVIVDLQNCPEKTDQFSPQHQPTIDDVRL